MLLLTKGFGLNFLDSLITLSKLLKFINSSLNNIVTVNGRNSKINLILNVDNNYKKETNYFYQGAVKITNTGIVGRESANRNGWEAMANGIEQSHACSPVSKSAEQS